MFPFFTAVEEGPYCSCILWCMALSPTLVLHTGIEPNPYTH